MNLDEAIEKRRSVRKYHPKKPNWKDIVEAIDAGRKAPLAGNIGSVKFVLVDDREIIEKIGEACQQDFVRQVDYIVVVCSDTRNVVRAYYEQGEVYCHQQAGAAIENFLLKITDLGLGSCWVGLFNQEKVRKAIKAKENIIIEAVLPVGYSIDKSARPRRPLLDNTLFFNQFENRLMKPRKKVEGI